MNKEKGTVEEARAILGSIVKPITLELTRVMGNVIFDLNNITSMSEKLIEGITEGLGEDANLNRSKVSYNPTLPSVSCGVMGCPNPSRHMFSFLSRRFRCCDDHYKKVNELFNLYNHEILEIQYSWHDDLMNLGLTKKRR